VQVVNGTPVREENFMPVIVEATALTEAEVDGVMGQLMNTLAMALSNGQPVNLGKLGIWSLSVSSVLETQDASVDPNTAVININVRPSEELMKAVRNGASYERLASREKAPGIESVTNMAAGGLPNQWTAGQNLKVRGEDLKIMDTADADQGVFLIIPAGPATERVDNFAINSNGELLFVVPAALATAGDISLEVRTKYTETGTLRVTRYNTLLTEA